MSTNDEAESSVDSEGEGEETAPAADQPDAEKTRNPLEEARAEIERVRDQLLRTAADYDNFRKRTRRELDDAQKRGREELLRELLPVFDNLERAVVHAGQASDPKAVADGVAIVLKQFADTLGRVGIKRIAAVGAPFDPAQHEAIQQIETDEHPAGTVVAEVQPGYAMGDRLVRAAMVVVAKPPRKNGEGEKREPN
ncbi:MAG TPA: nucleotide exchange factor GrpE [Polyangiaceae bacterium]